MNLRAFSAFLFAIATLLFAGKASATIIASLASQNGFARSVAVAGTGVIQIIDGSFVPLDDHGIVEVSLSTLTSPVTSAILELSGGVAANGLPLPNLFGIYGYAGDGSVGSGDFDAGSFLGNVSWDGSPTLAIDVTSFTNSLISNNDMWLGINIRMAQTTPASSFAYFNNGNSALPVLDVPEPSTGLLLVGGLLLATRGRRRKA